MMMQKAGYALLFAVAIQVACGPAERSLNEARSEIEVTGCLTGADDRFVLTELDRAETATTIASPSTETYRLIGDASVLRQHVGQQVRISGMAEAPDVAIVREASPAETAPPPAVGTGGADKPAGAGNGPAEPGARPKVSTQQQTRLEISALQVRSVRPTGSRCAP
jgi:hypothetical protein